MCLVSGQKLTAGGQRFTQLRDLMPQLNKSRSRASTQASQGSVWMFTCLGFG